MMIVSRVVAATAILMLSYGAPLLAQDAVKPAQPPKEKKICQQAMSTGSIMPRTVCHTKAEWAAISAQSRADSEHLRDSTLMHVEGSR